MSELKAINNFITNEWSFKLNNLTYNYINLYIGFSNGEPRVIFDNLSFGYELIGDGKTITETYPNPGVIYNETDETFITIDTFYLQPSTDYTLNLWCVNNNITSNGSYEFRTPDIPVPPSGTTFN
jgi:hypothetical protein